MIKSIVKFAEPVGNKLINRNGVSEVANIIKNHTKSLPQLDFAKLPAKNYLSLNPELAEKMAIAIREYPANVNNFADIQKGDFAKQILKYLA